MSNLSEWSGDQFRASWEEQASEIGRFNLAIFGKTGVGKSTLINAVFGEEVAETGVGEPVTMDNHLYLHRSGFFGLLDTRGLEIGKDTDTLIKNLGKYLKAVQGGDLSEQIHVAWYCIRATDRRFEHTEAEFIRKLSALGLPVIAVLTQVPSRNGVFHHDALALANHIASLDLPIAGGRPLLVMAAEDHFTGQVSHGLVELLDATFRVAPEGVEQALIAAQRIDLARKRKKAHQAVRTAAGLATAAGAIPIPVADAAVLVPIQLTMMTRIAVIFGVRKDVSALAATAATSALTAAGRSAVVGLVKLIPGAGTLVGGVISASVAGTFTLAMGYAWAVVCAEITQGRLKGADGMLSEAMVNKVFLDALKTWFAKMKPGKGSVDLLD